MQRKIKSLLLILIIGALSLPLLQFYLQIVNVKDLHGGFIKAKHSSFTIEDWFNNKFQDDYDSYFNENFGFRSSFVRINNQIDYTLFKKPHARGVVVGKDEYLFEKGYILSYQGQNFIGRDSVEYRVNRIQEIYEDLKKHQTELLIIIAPGKGFFYPEFIPDSLVQPRDTTNYEVFIETLKNSGISYIDFNELFLQMKDTATIVIYPKTGIHWSQGIVPYVADSIIKKVEYLLHEDLANISWTRTPNVSYADKQDADIEKGLNLIFPLKVPPMNYPNIQWEKKEGKSNPKMIAIADSFWWQLFNMGISKNSFDDAKFWYYYQQIFPDSFENPSFVDDIYALKELHEADLVILLATESNLHRFPFGFEDILYQPAPLPDSVFQIRIIELSNKIKNDPKWFESVKNKAEDRGISVDSMLYLDAKFILKQKRKK